MDQAVHNILIDCADELSKIKVLIEGKPLSTQVPFLTKYSLIKSCGTIEFSIKAIVSDKVSVGGNSYAQNFVDARIRKGSMNPSLHNIKSLLLALDKDLARKFEKGVQKHPDKSKITSGIKSLVELRNDFAHGNNIVTTIQDIQEYFANSQKVVEILDSVI